MKENKKASQVEPEVAANVDDPGPPRHYTREPWKVVIIAAVATGLLPIYRYWHVQQANTTGKSLPSLMFDFATAGAIAASLLVLRSHIRSVFWSTVVLWGGMFAIAPLVAWAVLVLKA